MRVLITIFLFILGCSSTPAIAQSADIKIVLVGDVMLADGPGRLIRAGQDPFRYVAAALKGADMTIGNLECVIASTGKPEPKPYTFRAPK